MSFEDEVIMSDRDSSTGLKPTRRQVLATAAVAGGGSLLAAFGPWGLTAAAAKEPEPEFDAPLVRLAAGANPASIQATVDLFRADLGTLNPNVSGSFRSGRREINWDGVPDAKSAPNLLPPDFFNTTSPRGVVLATPGQGFQVSAKAGNPTTTAVLFGNLSSAYPSLFTTFSPPRLFTALGSPVTDVRFFVPGTDTPALVNGFGAVFTDVVLSGSATITCFGVEQRSLGTFVVPATSADGLSFLGVVFEGRRVARVRILSGTTALSAAATNSGSTNVVAMDDFVYGEPQALARSRP
ncbi:MAG: hypothetical protein M3082_21640 [Candidatus Dormibacteraeota bacterium]|nr:hypothetical protein [Candidatus Dormibacteraeota bacterium]MDQ6900220.1 hypothetical protein [Candidatus Dormibacteraeota bacterium]